MMVPSLAIGPPIAISTVAGGGTYSSAWCLSSVIRHAAQGPQLVYCIYSPSTVTRTTTVLYPYNNAIVSYYTSVASARRSTVLYHVLQLVEYHSIVRYDRLTVHVQSVTRVV